MSKFRYKKYKGGARRLHGYNYSSQGAYFVTICTRNRQHYFGKIIDNKMQLNRFGQIAYRQWLWLANQYKYVGLDEFIVMPNHMHGIMIIKNMESVGAGRDLHLPERPTKIKSLSELIGAFKTTSSKLIHQSRLNKFQWQSRFHDRIIRNKGEFDRIGKYIRNNPKKWWRDRNNI